MDIGRLRELLPRIRRHLATAPPPVPMNEFEFCKAFVEGRITAANIDPRNPLHTTYLANLAAAIALNESRRDG